MRGPSEWSTSFNSLHARPRMHWVVVFWAFLLLPAFTHYLSFYPIGFSGGLDKIGWPLVPTGMDEPCVPVILSPVYKWHIIGGGVNVVEDW